MKNNQFQYLIYLFFILIFAHFIPFGRLSLAPDDLSLMQLTRNGINNFFIYSDRPILFLFLELQYLILRNNVSYYFYLLIISNYILIIFCYKLILLFYDKYKSFVISTIFIVVLYKLEMYQNSIMIHINFSTSLYLISLYYLLKFLNNNRIYSYLIAIISYLIAIFWYEIGFFIPFIIYFYFDTKLSVAKKTKYLVPFVLLMFFYSLYRITGFFGLAEDNVSHNISPDFITGTYEIIKHFFGRYFIKNLVYGYYQFIKMPLILILFFISINFIFFYFLQYKIKHLSLGKNNKKLFFFMFLFLLSLIPMILNGKAGGRNLIIPSISFAFFIYYFLYELYNKKIFLNFLILFFLISSQGNSFAQYIASNIHYSILNEIENNKNSIVEKKFFVFDAASLKENIDHSLVNNNYNLINTYYGAQVWETWGINSIISNLDNNSSIITYFAANEPKINEENLIIEYILEHKNNTIITDTIKLDRKDVFILNYNLIYKNGFINGLSNE